MNELAGVPEPDLQIPHWIGFEDFPLRRNSKLLIEMTTRADQWLKVVLTIETMKEVWANANGNY